MISSRTFVCASDVTAPELSDADAWTRISLPKGRRVSEETG